MHKKLKRTLSAVLVLTMVLSLCTVGAFAADVNGKIKYTNFRH